MRHHDIRRATRDARAVHRGRVWLVAGLALLVGLALVFAHFEHFVPAPAFAAASIVFSLALVPLAAVVDRVHSRWICSLAGARAKLSAELAEAADHLAQILAVAAGRAESARHREPPPPPAVGGARRIASLALSPRLLAQRPQPARA